MLLGTCAGSGFVIGVASPFLTLDISACSSVRRLFGLTSVASDGLEMRRRLIKVEAASVCKAERGVSGGDGKGGKGGSGGGEDSGGDGSVDGVGVGDGDGGETELEGF